MDGFCPGTIWAVLRTFHSRTVVFCCVLEEEEDLFLLVGQAGRMGRGLAKSDCGDHLCRFVLYIHTSTYILVNGNTYFRPAWQHQRRPVAARSVTTTTVLLISSPMVLQDD